MLIVLIFFLLKYMYIYSLLLCHCIFYSIEINNVKQVITKSKDFVSKVCQVSSIFKFHLVIIGSKEVDEGTMYIVQHFYPTAFKGCRGIVFTHGVRMGGWAGGGKKFVRAVSQKP